MEQCQLPAYSYHSYLFLPIPAIPAVAIIGGRPPAAQVMAAKTYFA